MHALWPVMVMALTFILTLTPTRYDKTPNPVTNPSPNSKPNPSYNPSPTSNPNPSPGISPNTNPNPDLCCQVFPTIFCAKLC